MSAALGTKQDTLTFSHPSDNHTTNPSSSAQIKSALDNKQDTLTSSTQLSLKKLTSEHQVIQPSTNALIPLTIANNFPNQWTFSMTTSQHGGRILSNTTNSAVSLFYINNNNKADTVFRVKGNGTTEIKNLQIQSSLIIDGAIHKNIDDKSSNHTIGDNDYIITNKGASGDISSTLPIPSSSNVGRELIFINKNGNHRISINCTGKINNNNTTIQNSIDLLYTGQCCKIISCGDFWNVISINN